ncbi:hypothetical protein KZO01_20300 [Kurthia zopfii]|uniref:LPXTG cell wall anchor domain-containing protein n=1 Tax=Kurthia zopfii TaxID=1650 RepID=A0A2U3AEL6_9BACL|nr:hypothetical protein [Kurthia zopfii]PWI22986.1 hypothetical protein DF281_04895 [Kurthia zopfii]TDR40910.1 hypothetical protein DFR61_10725 [Kurthia zopfii]STX09742.1 Uncharacterised protein [Kurthia zopfii]VEI07039.1 Uncharacterised protein [Kurthia zopfii]GEK31721.1 hypothetical protein KZO01_20300 [Kurthia zopfii]
MKGYIMNTIVGSSFDSVASLTEKKETSTFLNLSQNDIWLFVVAIIGLIILAMTILFVMKNKKTR